MDDKTIMTTILNNVKGVCDLMMHGRIESSTTNVNNVFDSTLDDMLCMQKDIYDKMMQKGWYTAEQVEQQKIQQTKQKYCCQ